MSNDTVVIKKSGFLNFMIGLLVLVLVVILLLTFFPIGGGKGTTSSKLDVLTARIFSENIELMQDTAKEYFTIDRLPKKVGDTVVLTLEEMYDEDLLLELTDSNGEACIAIASYVKVTRLEDKYEMHTTLVCNDEVDTIVNYFDLECGLSCNVCEEEEEVVNKTTTSTTTKKIEKKTSYTVYKYQRTTYVGSWSEWSGWTTEVKTADDVQTKTQYIGRKLVPSTITYYTHTKTVTTPGYTTQVWGIVTPAVTKSCPVKVESHRECATCAIIPAYTYYVDCSTEAVYGWVDQYVEGTSTTETIKTTNSYEAGYTLKSTEVVDNSYYVYTNSWVDSLASGYTQTSTRTLYRYRYYTVTSSIEYTTSTNSNLSDGWELIGSSTVTTG